MMSRGFSRRAYSRHTLLARLFVNRLEVRRVSVSVVDTEGRVLGIFRTTDAPVFGYDVAVQKARTVAFYTNANAAGLLRGAGFGSYVDRAAADGLALNGSVAFSDRAVGFSRARFP
jgi:hypothetical protein